MRHDDIAKLTDLYLDAVAHGDQAAINAAEAALDNAGWAENARRSATEALGQAARWYASRGVPVFPCKPAQKVPATPHGFKDATTDPRQVAAWWLDNPDYNIGLPTGGTFDVFDIDGVLGHRAFLDKKAAGRLPAIIAVARTPRGWHYYVPPLPGRGNKAGLVEQIDYRGAGGYVLAPPSRIAPVGEHPGGMYRWLDGHILGDTR